MVDLTETSGFSQSSLPPDDSYNSLGVSPVSATPTLPDTSAQTYAKAAAYGIPGLGVGMIDSMGQSLGLLKDDTVQNTLNGLSTPGSGGFADFYARNREPLRMGGEIVGLALPGTIALKVLKSVRYATEVGALGSALKNSTAVRMLLGSSADLTTLEQGVADAVLNARRSQGIFAGRTLALPTVLTAKRDYYTARALESVRQTVAFEGAYRALYNNSELLSPADYTLTDQVKWGAVGLAGQVGMDFAVGRYAVRSLIKAQNARAVTGVNASLFTSSLERNVSNVIFRPNDRGPGVTYFAALKNQRQGLITASGDATFAANTAQDTAQFDAIIKKNLDDMTTDPHLLLPKSKLSDGQAQLGVSALKKDDSLFLFATKLGQLPADQAEFYGQLDDFRSAATKKFGTDQMIYQVMGGDKVKFDAALDDYNAHMAVANEIHYVIENDGRYNVYSNRAANWLDTNNFDNMNRTTFTDSTIKRKNANGDMVDGTRSQLNVKGDVNFALQDDFNTVMSSQGGNADVFDNQAKIPNLSQADYSGLYAAGSRMIAEWKPVENQRFILNEKLPWRQVEMTLALAKGKSAAANLIDYGGLFKNSQDAEFFVLNNKYKEFTKLMPSTENPPLTGIGSSLLRRNKLTPAQVIQRLNLPEPVGMEPHPLIKFFGAAQAESQPDLYAMFDNPSMYGGQADHPLALLKAGVKEQVEGPVNGELNLNGPLLGQAQADDRGNVIPAVKPIFVAATSTPTLSLSEANLHGMIETNRDIQLSRLFSINPQLAPLVSMVTTKLTDLPATNIARNVQSLFEGVASGRGLVTAQDRVAEQFPVLKAAALISQDTEKAIDTHVAALSAPVLTPQVGKVLKSKPDLFDFNRIEQAYRHGWEIEAPEPSESGGFQFRLKEDSVINQRLLAQHFGSTDIDEEASGLMPDMSISARKQGYIPLVVSQDAGTLAQEISSMSRQSGIENNALRNALGQSGIKIRDFHLPSPELNREGTWFVKNSSDNVVATYTGGLSPDNRRRAIDAASKLSAATDEVHTAIPLSVVKLQHQTFDDHFFDVIDYSDQLAKDGAIKGGLVRSEIDTGPETLSAMVKSLHQQFLNVGTRARAAIFEPELNYAKQVSQTLENPASMGEINIFDRYQATLLSRTPQAPTGNFAKVYGAFETAGDRALSWVYSHYAEMTAGSQASIDGARGLRRLINKQSLEDEIAGFKSQAGNFSPFEDTQDFLESTYRERTPPSVRQLTAKLAVVSSSLSLRVLDVGTAINNLLGTVATGPAVVAGLRRLSNESHQDWIDRTAAWGTQLVDGISTFSPMKAMSNVSRAWWNGELTEPMAAAAKLGYFDPEYSALAKVLANPQYGGKGNFAQWVDKASYLADHSEILSRKIAWGMGYKIGKELHGFDDERNAYLFANNFLNDMIGNYNPKNKPAMFQGAIGLPLGAFQTYMFNFYRRVYGYIERGDIRSIAAQYAVQASLFGAKSVPGWGALNATLFNNYDGSDDLGTRLERKLPPGVSELLLNGSLSGLPAIFGHDSPAFYTRGSVDFTQPVPTIFDASRAPPIQFLAETFQGIKATLQNIFSAGGFSRQQQEEILANFTTNRALKTIAEMAANAKTDQRGEVIQYGTRDLLHVAQLFTGAAPSSTRHLQEAYVKQQAVEFTQSDMRNQLNAKTRALIRSGSFDTSDFQDIVQAYVHAGGNPAYLGEWLRNSQLMATTPKAITKMDELARTGKWLEFLNTMTTIQQHQ